MGLIEKRNNAEAEKAKLQRTHDKLIKSFQKLDDALRQQEKRNLDRGDSVGPTHTMGGMKSMKTMTMGTRRSSIQRRQSVVAPRKSIIVKSLRGGLTVKH